MQLSDAQSDALWYEIKGMMDEAEADPESVQPLSSDEEGYVERLMDGRTAPYIARCHKTTFHDSDLPQPVRRTSVPSSGGAAFSQRIQAVFDGLTGNSVSSTPSGVLPSGRVGPAFESQARGYSLAEPVAQLAQDSEEEEDQIMDHDHQPTTADDDDDDGWHNAEDEAQDEEQDMNEWSRRMRHGQGLERGGA